MSRPGRSRPLERARAVVEDWRGGCLYCAGPAPLRPLPWQPTLVVPLCDRHLRWALAARRERWGKEAAKLQRLLSAWVACSGQSQDDVDQWLQSKS
jgi:hypothetical protein